MILAFVLTINVGGLVLVVQGFLTMTFIYLPLFPSGLPPILSAISVASTEAVI